MAGSEKDSRRIAGYAQWVLYNLQFPLFLVRDILAGDATWMLAAMRELSMLQAKSFMDGVMPVNLFAGDCEQCRSYHSGPRDFGCPNLCPHRGDKQSGSPRLCPRLDLGSG